MNEDFWNAVTAQAKAMPGAKRLSAEDRLDGIAEEWREDAWGFRREDVRRIWPELAMTLDALMGDSE